MSERIHRKAGHVPKPPIVLGEMPAEKKHAREDNAHWLIARAICDPVSALKDMLSDPRVRALLTGRIESRRRARVEICKRVADIPVAKQVGLEHWWIRTEGIESGMGPAEGGVPGENCDYPGRRTAITDHRGQGDSADVTCIPASQENVRWEHEDEKCLEQVMAINRDSGRWLPWNQCHSIVKDALDECRIPEAPGAEVPVMGTHHRDAGAE